MLHEAVAKFWENPSELNRSNLIMFCALDKMRRMDNMKDVYAWLKTNTGTR